MAKAFVASNMQYAKTYYEQFPQEPVGGGAFVTVRPVRLIPATAAGLFTALRQHCRAGDAVLIVAHSSEHGLALWLVDDSPFGLNEENVNLIESVLAAPAARRPAAEAELAANAKLSAEATSSLLADIRAVQALRLSAVHFRGCNLGEWEGTLKTFRQFFGCSRATGLKLRSGFALMPAPTILTGGLQGSATSSKRQLKGSQEARSVTDGPPGQRLRFRYTINSRQHTLSFARVEAESTRSAPAFIERNLPPPAAVYTGGVIPVHCLLELGELVFPYANRRPNPKYAASIVESRPSTDIF